VSARPLSRLQRAVEGEEEFVGREEESSGSALGEPTVQRVAAFSPAAIQRAVDSSGAPPSRGAGGRAVRAVTPSIAAAHAKAAEPAPPARQLLHAPPVRQLSRAPAPEGSAGGRSEAGRAGDTPPRSFASESSAGDESMPLAVVARKAVETEPVPAAHSVARFPDAGAEAVAAGVATPDGNGSVVFRTPIVGDGFGSFPETSPGVLQRQEATGELSTPTGYPEPSQGEELEKLAYKLEEKLFRRLRQQLWLLRERKGKLADL
jgi:hypothetical protein